VLIGVDSRMIEGGMMADIKIAFWNLENLFDITASPIAADLEFTPADGWNQAAMEAKINNLAEVINLMHGGQGPDLLGICEIEHEPLVKQLITATGRTDLKVATYKDSPDIRGIDVSLIYSDQVFKQEKGAESHLIHLRYPTRDIFEVPLTVKQDQATLRVLVNHWPSRRQGRWETEPLRITVAEHCGRVIDQYLKLGRDDFLALPNTQASLNQLNDLWNQNVIVMGDFNDEPFDRSILDYLQATKDLDLVEEQIKKGSGSNQIPTAATYLGKKAYLFNCMWPTLGQSDTGTHYFGGSQTTPKPSHTMDLLDQFIISRGLYYGEQQLKLDPASVEIFTPSVMTTPSGRPRPFNRQTKKGYSDHFPIQCVIQTV
jgi:hypothetical protein